MLQNTWPSFLSRGGAERIKIIPKVVTIIHPLLQVKLLSLTSPSFSPKILYVVKAFEVYCMKLFSKFSLSSDILGQIGSEMLKNGQKGKFWSFSSTMHRLIYLLFLRSTLA